MDVGTPINQIIDIGQIQGSFIQGLIFLFFFLIFFKFSIKEWDILQLKN
jgi:xanthine dehydrogenase molybdopterin-binding subunit B